MRERRELLRTSRFGHVRAIAVDREGSSVYLLTLESAELLRLDPERGSVTVELTAAREPLLAESTFMQFEDDARFGRSLKLYTGETGGCIVGTFDRTLEFVDADCDGRFERHLVWRDRDWEPDLGYVGWVRP
ncbi:MAG: hypothetical protein HZA52_14055 [Planctomycetes bacterium]|nr:hypothetical protein [Planctomycetota bacterium]